MKSCFFVISAGKSLPAELSQWWAGGCDHSVQGRLVWRTGSERVMHKHHFWEFTQTFDTPLHFTSSVFASFAERTCAQPVTQPWEMSHAWSLTESERGSLFSSFTINVSFNTDVKVLALHSEGVFVLPVCSRPRSFKQLIGGLDDVKNKQCESNEVKAKWVNWWPDCFN